MTGPDSGERARREVTRRRVLEAGLVSGVAGTAGCIDGGDDSGGQQGGNDTPDDRGGGNGGGRGDDGGEGDGRQCADVDDAYTPYDAGATALICAVDVPSPFADDFGAWESAIHRGRYRFQRGGEERTLTIRVEQTMDPDTVSAATENHRTGAETMAAGDVAGGEVAVETRFDGETVRFTHGEMREGSNGRGVVVGDLPYDVQGHRLYFPMTVDIQYQNPPAALDAACGRATRAAVEDVAASMRVNDATTVETVVEEDWPDYPWDWLE
jgi:hypothetical protein